MTLRRLLSATLAAAFVSLPSLAHACGACGVGNGRNAIDYLTTTVFLSLLPLGIIGAGLVWLARNGRAFLASEFRERDEAGPAETREAGPARP